MDLNRCGRNKCSSNVRRSMQCDTCKSWWEFKCAGLEEDQVSQLANFPDPFVCASHLYLEGEVHSANKKTAVKDETKSPLVNRKDQYECPALIGVLDAKLVLLYEALEDTNTRNTATCFSSAKSRIISRCCSRQVDAFIINGNPVTHSTEIKELGLRYSCASSVSHQVQFQVARARRLSPLILRSFYLGDTMVATCKLCVQPIVEFCPAFFSFIPKRSWCQSLGLELLWLRFRNSSNHLICPTARTNLCHYLFLLYYVRIFNSLPEQNLMNMRELGLGYTGTASSWHRQYKDSAWIFIGGLNFELTEGDIICVFSQYGEVVNINLVRDKKTGISKGFAFLCYEDQRSTVLATDNLNGIKLAGRIIRVDHVEKYKVPTDGTVDVGTGKKKRRIENINDKDAVSAFVREHGCGPEVMKHLKKLEAEAHKGSHNGSRDTLHSGNRRNLNDDNVSGYSRDARNPSPSPTRTLGSSNSQRYKTDDSISLSRTKKESSLSPPRKRSSLSPPRKQSSSVSPAHKQHDSQPSPPRRRTRCSPSTHRIKQESPEPYHRVRELSNSRATNAWPTGFPPLIQLTHGGDMLRRFLSSERTPSLGKFFLISVQNTIRHLFTRVLALANILPRAENLKSSATPFFHLCLSGGRQLLNDKNKTDPGNLGKSLAPVYQSVKNC
ncbi:RNA-binding motif protein, X-linked 2 [Clonorchis sinensis]|uniref:RNA-binding motif protein, X-linked 2 n=1 Tax=Clonorchis sinensis TaxID=79923 RepID=A0A3R7GUY5_CLOSI|nr:RNA-binding motif protein, X-linked 2 [Clonorchis sinensis]